MEQAGLGKYCVHLLADYITAAAAPPLDMIGAAQKQASTTAAQGCLEALTGPPAAALRQGALALYGACSPAEVCALPNLDDQHMLYATMQYVSQSKCWLTLVLQNQLWHTSNDGLT